MSQTDIKYPCLDCHGTGADKVKTEKAKANETSVEQMKRITFTIGIEFDKHGERILGQATILLKQAFTRIAKDYGGYTATRGQGGWVDGTGKLIQEGCIVITCIVPDGNGVAPTITAGYLKELFNQEAIMVMVEPLGEVTFV